MTGPGSAQALATNKAFRCGVTSCSMALATAERTTFSIMPLARCLLNRRRLIASSTLRPRIRFINSRALRGEMRAKECLAWNAMNHLTMLRPLVP